MTQTRKSKELDHYLKSVINSVPTKLESFMSSEDKKMTYYTGNWATDVLNNYTEKQSEKIECECGASISRSNISRHKKSKKHLSYFS